MSAIDGDSECSGYTVRLVRPGDYLTIRVRTRSAVIDLWGSGLSDPGFEAA